jgi:L-threonylcarbamoyladenylate synthase
MISLEMEKLKISKKNLNEVVEKTLKFIKQGKVVVCPTDTVYGLIADATNKKAVKKVFQIKKRTFQKPIPIFVKDLKMARSLAIINKNQEKFLKKFWPGKATVILKAKNQKFPKGVVSVDKKIGLRIPNYKIINQLLLILKCPLTGTSANISGKPESTKINEVLKQFKNQKYKPDLILDAGNLKPSLPSTAIDLENFKILREGEFPREEILKILKKKSEKRYKE